MWYANRKYNYIHKWINIVWMNKPLVLCTYFVEGLLSSTISQVFTIFYDCLICSCCTFSHLFYFPNLVKTDLLYILLQNYMRRDELVLIGHIKQSVPQFTSGSCNCGNHSVIVFSFTTTQSKIKKKTHWAEAHLTFYFSLSFTYLLTALIFWESFLLDFGKVFSYPVTPKRD